MKWKKRMIWMVGTLGVVAALTGCGRNYNKRTEEAQQYADSAFVEDAANGLQARWDLNKRSERKEDYMDVFAAGEGYKERTLCSIDTELSFIEKYTEKRFEDSNLQEIAITYINLLNRHKEACNYINVDYDRYYEEYETIYNKRSSVIERLVKDYGLTVPGKYQNALNEILMNSWLVEEKEAQEEQIGKMIGGLKFHETNYDGGGMKTYQTLIENTTGMDFKTFRVSINLLNAKGVIVDTVYDQVSAFKNGMTARLEFISDKEFASTQVSVDWWER
ncbi:MAG: FxLYD domain-containing protein [Eubacteriales bacterium]|nr:FxLYD domain-containing protein [Eubacteriales bacterium]